MANNTGKVTMQQLDAAMQYASYPIKKLLLSNYEGQISKEELQDEYGDNTACVTLALDHKKKVKIYIDLVENDYQFSLDEYDLEDKDKIANVMVFLRICCLDLCTPLYTQRFELPSHLAVDTDKFTYYIDKEDKYRLAIIIEPTK